MNPIDVRLLLETAFRNRTIALIACDVKFVELRARFPQRIRQGFVNQTWERCHTRIESASKQRVCVIHLASRR